MCAEVQHLTAQLFSLKHIRHAVVVDNFIAPADAPVADPNDDITEHIVSTYETVEAET